MSLPFIHPSAIVEEGAELGAGCKIWHFCHVQAGARLGQGCQLGHATFIAGSVVLGDRVRVQNHVSVFAPAVVEDDVFLGPGCMVTNLPNPRAEIPRMHLAEGVYIRRGATVGANATLLPGITLGRFAFVAAGAVVTRSVPDFGFCAGVPARADGFMSRHGHRLRGSPGEIVRCPESGLRYRVESPTVLVCLDLDPDAPLAPAASSQATERRQEDGHEVR